jgi:hypothetical protein
MRLDHDIASHRACRRRMWKPCIQYGYTDIYCNTHTGLDGLD